MDPVTWAAIGSAAGGSATAATTAAMATEAAGAMSGMASVAASGLATSSAMEAISTSMIGSAFTAIPTLLSVGGALMGANQQAQAAKSEASQLEANSKATMAAGSKEIGRLDYQRQMIESNAMANAAAGGGNTLDPSTVHILGSLEAQGQENESNALYNSKSQANSYTRQAAADRFTASQYGIAGPINAVKAFYNPQNSLASKYGSAMGYG